MIVSIHQPQYLPWLGYFDKIRRSDVFVFLDNVQFKKNEWQNRNRIKTAEGGQWLTVPVIHRFSQKISEVRINTTVQWGKKHLRGLLTNYSRAPYFQEYISFFEQAYEREWQYLAELNMHIIRFLTEALGVREKRFELASAYEAREDRTGRLVDLCRQLGADSYLSGRDGAGYLNLKEFEQERIQVIFQDFKHPRYPQLFGDFEPFLSVIDLLFNCGPGSLSILTKGE